MTRWFTGLRQPSTPGVVCVALLVKTSPGRVVRTTDQRGTPLQAALTFDRVQRLLFKDPAERRVNFAREPGEWQYVVRRGGPLNQQQRFLQYLPAARLQKAAVWVPTLFTPPQGKTHKPLEQQASPSPPKRPRVSSSGGTLQKPPASLSGARRGAAPADDAVVDSDGYFSDASAASAPDTAAALDTPAWLKVAAAAVKRDSVSRGGEAVATSEYLAAARQVPPRPLPATAEEKASLHLVVRGVHRRVYRCIRHCPSDSTRFAVKSGLAAHGKAGETFATPMEAALAADEILRAVQPVDALRLVNFKKPGSEEMQYLPCSKGLRLVVYRGITDVPGKDDSSSPDKVGGVKRSRE